VNAVEADARSHAAAHFVLCLGVAFTNTPGEIGVAQPDDHAPILRAVRGAVYAGGASLKVSRM